MTPCNGRRAFMTPCNVRGAHDPKFIPLTPTTVGRSLEVVEELHIPMTPNYCAGYIAATGRSHKLNRSRDRTRQSNKKKPAAE